MLKLYNSTGNQLHYWETWDKNETTAIVHWGVVGERGYDKEIIGDNFKDFRELVQNEIDEKLKEGYAELDDDQIFSLEIEYKIAGFGTEEELKKRHKLEAFLNELLGWTGLGHVDGGSIGSGTMEVGCLVVNFDIARKLVEDTLKNTEFADYSRIFRPDEE